VPGAVAVADSPGAGRGRRLAGRGRDLARGGEVAKWRRAAAA
jgi:hypothetical protein